MSFGAPPVLTETGQGPCAPTSVNFTDIVTETNAGDGLEVNAAGPVTLNTVNASSNGNAIAQVIQQDGIDITHVRAPGGTLLLRNCTANGNRDDGADLNPRTNVTVETCQFNSNGADGFDTAATADSAGGHVALFDTDVMLNIDDGFDIDATGNLTVQQARADGNLSDGLFVKRVLGTVSVSASSFTASGQAGVHLRALGAGTHRIEDSDFIGNAFGAANLTSTATLLFNRNYWGSPSGPTHPSNPGGTGDRVYDGATGGVGAINFTGFLAASALPSAIPVRVPALATFGLVLLGGLLVLIAVHRRTSAAS